MVGIRYLLILDLSERHALDCSKPPRTGRQENLASKLAKSERERCHKEFQVVWHFGEIRAQKASLPPRLKRRPAAIYRSGQTGYRYSIASGLSQVPSASLNFSLVMSALQLHPTADDASPHRRCRKGLNLFQIFQLLQSFCLSQ